MDKFVIEGRTPLHGEVSVHGAKNAVLPLMAAALLARGKSVIENVPDLRDVATMVKMLDLLGAVTTRTDGDLVIDTTHANGIEAPYDLVRTMRASIYVLAPTLAVHGRARVSMPGGCAWGPRPIDLHLMAMEKLGAKVELSHGYIEATCERLRGGEVVFPISSVGATAQTIMAASLADGVSVIENAALEPEITDLVDALVECGVEIEGRGTSRVVVHGTTSVKPLKHRVIPDRIEAETFAAAAAITGGDVTIVDCDPAHMGSVFAVLEAGGCKIDAGERRVRVVGPERLAATDVVTREYPGFPTDMQAQIIAALCTADGVSTVKETIYPDRFTHVPELRRFGADIRLDGNLAVIRGVPSLSGAPVMATDIRASSGLILAAMAAEGRSEILRVYHIDRGYQRIESKLNALGARIERVVQ
ncbi:MAG TPA: UDP-N-acetylglucosamine 1-carboxyvinyltransferase [Candidatus Krumholzibacteria bacterium]|nr:UDP-N-acetylglucosamine 1-carboxyvinyltransferase [Candidatus Krumholzibacteria bacterium]